MYQLAYIQRPNSRIDYIKYTNENGAMFSIPFDPDNTDYQAYLEFLEEGGQPLPADDNGQTS